MKTKVLVQVLIVAILGTLTVQAQENINRDHKKEMRNAKREVRKVKKDLKKNMKDIHFDAFYFDGDKFEGKFLKGDEGIFLYENKLDHLEDVLADLEVDMEGFEFMDEMEPLEYMFEMEPLEHIVELEALEHLEIEMPEMNYRTLDLDIRLPKVYELNSLYEEQGSILELSKDLEDVSISKDFYFDVKDGAATLDMNIDGTLEAGDLTITVKKPDGEIFQKFQISPLADVDWNQKIDLDEKGENYSGKWTIILSGEGATGYYSLRFKAR